MKRTLLFAFILVSTSITAISQNSNAVFFNQTNTRFQVVLNGVLQNNSYETNVKVTDLKFEGSYKVTINFEDAVHPSITKSIYIMDKNTEYSYEIAKNKKGIFVLKQSGMVAIENAPKTVENQAAVQYSTTAPTQTTTQSTSTVLAPQTDVNTTETITTTTVINDPANAENVSMGVNVGGVGMNINVNINDGGMNTGTAVQSTTTHTTTTTKVTSNTSSNDAYLNNSEMTTNPVHEAVPAQPLDGCYQAVSSTDFSAGKNTIKKQSFADTQLKTAKTFTKNNCLSVAQIKEVIGLFSFEESKLEYAKYAYDYCVDKKNYYQVADVFTFSGSVDELNEFLETK